MLAYRRMVMVSILGFFDAKEIESLLIVEFDNLNIELLFV